MEGNLTTNILSAASVPSGSTYAVTLVATNGISKVNATSAQTFLAGDVSTAKGADAVENGLVPGSFLVLRPAGSTQQPLVVNYTITSEKATPGTAYVIPAGAAVTIGNTITGSVTIAAAATNATVSIVPKLHLGLDENATLTLTLSEGLYGISGTGSASMTLVNRVFAKPLNCARQVTLTVAGIPSGTALTNFPVLVRLSTAISGFTYADFKTAGLDMLFVDTNGTQLSYEVDTWKTNGTSLVWVKVPTATNGTKIKLYWGTDKDVANTPSDVWTKYVTVVHGGVFSDASPKANAVANGGGVVVSNAAGVVGSSFYKAARNSIGVNVANPYTAALFTNNRQYTISAWARSSEASDTKVHVFFGGVTAWGGAGFLGLFENGAGGKGFSVAVSSTHQLTQGEGKLLANTWRHTAFAYDTQQGRLKIFSDGTNILNKTDAVTYTDSGTTYWTFGSYANTLNGDSFFGDIDEIRIYDGLVSDDWAKAEYDSMANAAFLSYGTVGEVPEPATLLRIL